MCPLLLGSLLVDVTITDVNDNGPLFARPAGSGGNLTPSEARLPESVPVGTPVHRITATDPDDGPNGEVTYEFASDTVRDYGDQFAIDSATGQIYTRSTFDHERQAVYVLYVVASDGGVTDRKSAQTSVVVRIDDVNDNAPRIRVNGLTNAVPRPEIGNGSEAGAFVAHLTVDDPDAGQSGRFHCRITTGSELFELKQLYATEFKVVVAAGARITTPNLSSVLRLAISCRDNGIPEMTSTLPLEVAVIARNDHAPVFQRSEYRFDVIENSSAGTAVGRVESKDVDSGPGGHVTYRVEALGKDQKCPVKVEPETGLMTVAADGLNVEPFDRERSPSCELEVIASDGGQPTRSSRVRVTIVVADVDDESVHFHSDRYSFVITENQPAGTEVGTVSASDADLPPFNEVTYYIDEESHISGLSADGGNGEMIVDAWNELGLTGGTAFSVDPYTGRISTTVSLDRELIPRYTLRLVATSTCHGMSSSATSTVVIDVADLNDNDPVFEFPSDTEDIITRKRNNVVIVVLNTADNVPIASSLPEAPPLATVRATDSDTGPNAVIEYRLLSAFSLPQAAMAASPAAMRLFKVDKSTGELRLADDVNWTSPEIRRLTTGGNGVIELELAAIDRGGTSHDDGDNEIGSVTSRRSTTAKLLVYFRPGGPGVVPGGSLSPLPHRDDGVLIDVLSSEHLAVVLACTLAIILVVISIVIATICLFRSQLRRRRQARMHHCEVDVIKVPPSATDKTDGKQQEINAAPPYGSVDRTCATSPVALGLLSVDATPVTMLNGSVRIYDPRQNGNLPAAAADSLYEVVLIKIR
jgi:hypothetical protein